MLLGMTCVGDRERMPRWASASRPGSKARFPSVSARETSNEPVTRSIEAPTGSSTKRTGRVRAAAPSWGPSGQRCESRSPGRQENAQPSITSTSGSRAASERTAVDFAVVYILTHGGPFNSTQVLTTWAYAVGIDGGSLGEGAAISLFLFPLLVVVTVGMLFFARRAQVS